ncbi:hypothetical protein UPYG_G00239640 [Umbra pygmaea]|uniref:C2H2-type domain-containing protein n=1 Tax=Umbra pygmaea TaxID=75934 RepID=A0ABD0WK19_UMBPY
MDEFVVSMEDEIAECIPVSACCTQHITGVDEGNTGELKTDGKVQLTVVLKQFVKQTIIKIYQMISKGTAALCSEVSQSQREIMSLKIKLSEMTEEEVSEKTMEKRQHTAEEVVVSTPCAEGDETTIDKKDTISIKNIVMKQCVISLEKIQLVSECYKQGPNVTKQAGSQRPSTGVQTQRGDSVMSTQPKRRTEDTEAIFTELTSAETDGREESVDQDRWEENADVGQSSSDESLRNIKAKPKRNQNKTGTRQEHLCPDCGKVFKSLSNFKLHQQTHTGARPYCCELCGKFFTTAWKLRNHQLVIHRKEKPLECPACGKCFATKSYLDRHANVHSTEKPFQCLVCQKSFKRKNCLKEHTMLHNSNSYACDICPKTFIKLKYLKNHQLTHTGGGEYRCEMCERGFKSRSILKQHQASVHMGEKPFQCPTCGKCFAEKQHLKNHASVHSEERAFQCTQCQMRFKTKYILNDHKKTHTDSKPYACDKCPMTFIRSKYLKMHQASHLTSKPLACSHCGKGFKGDRERKRHERTHTEEPPYICDKCGKGFYKHHSLKVHSALHTGEKPFACDNCSKTFALSSYLKSHVAKFHSVTKHICGKCGKKYKDIINFRCHIVQGC